MADTARDIVTDILRKIHVLGAGASLDETEANDVLSTVNDMLATWSVQGNLVFTETEETFNLVNGQAAYTIGSGGDFNTTRPVKITSAYISIGDTDYPLVSYEQAEYSAIADKEVTGTPDIYYYDADFPLATIKLYPVPSGVDTITINSEKPLTGFTDLDTVYALPPEYRSAIVYNGAVWVAPEYEREASMTVKKLATQTKTAVKTQNAKNNKNSSVVDAPQQSGTTTGNVYRGYE